MSPLKRLSLFFLGCSLIYALLVVPWPGLLDGYRALFRAGGNALFSSYGPGGSVHFKSISSADHARDTTLVMGNDARTLVSEMEGAALGPPAGESVRGLSGLVEIAGRL